MFTKVRLLLSELNQKRLLIERDLRYSNSIRKDRTTDLTSLLIEGHVLEKGITMPNRREGFGYERVRNLIEKCRDCIKRYGADTMEIQAAISDLEQYYKIHHKSGFNLPQDIKQGIESLLLHSSCHDENCYYTTKEEYFKKTLDYAEFAMQRRSIRNYSEQEVDDERIIKAINLAQLAPSACNRQSVRIKIIKDNDVLNDIRTNIQNGNRGFGHLSKKWLLVTSELGAWSHDQESMAYIDGGIFIMSLLNALHYYGICACTLNSHLSYEKQNRLRNLLGYPKSEVAIVFIAIGMPADSFMIAKSRRKSTESIIQMI